MAISGTYAAVNSLHLAPISGIFGAEGKPEVVVDE